MRIKQPFLFGAIGYPLLELAFRGRSHWTMGLLGGASMQLMAKLSRTRLSLLPAALLSGMGITAMGLVAGHLSRRRAGRFASYGETQETQCFPLSFHS